MLRHALRVEKEGAVAGMMEQQVRALTDELNALKAEIVNIKAGHAALHQRTVEVGSTMTEQESRIGALETSETSKGWVWYFC